jgi:endogenous inhibitor of DNA gyrase (YacG/DUF329 family)
MTDTQRTQIKELYLAGYGYKKIAQTLCLSVNTVKSYCRRNVLNGTSEDQSEPDSFCRQCNAILTHTPGKKKKEFCSDKCRMKWWNAHPEKVRHKTTKKYICVTCGMDFTDHVSRERKFCSRSCYSKSKVVAK